ncbi:MAG: RNA polymerase sigma factor [Pirellula sp.]
MHDPSKQMAAAKAGDLQAIFELIVVHRDWLSTQIEPKIPHRFRGVLDVDDILQESFCEAILDFCDFNPEAPLRAWLLSIAKNNLIDAVRSLSAIKRGGSIKINSSLDAKGIHDGYDELLDLIAGTTTPPSQKLLNKQAFEKLGELLNLLPDDSRRVLNLYYFSGKSPDQVAQELDCKLVAMFMRRNRAIKMLQKLAKREEFSPPG